MATLKIKQIINQISGPFQIFYDDEEAYCPRGKFNSDGLSPTNCGYCPHEYEENYNGCRNCLDRDCCNECEFKETTCKGPNWRKCQRREWRGYKHELPWTYLELTVKSIGIIQVGKKDCEIEIVVKEIP